MHILAKYKSLPRPVKAAGWFLVCGILQRGIQVIVTPVFTRVLTTEEYGLFTLYSSWLEILGVLLTLNLSYGVFMQGMVRYGFDRDKYTSSLQALTTLIVLAGLAVYLPFAGFWNGLTGLNSFIMLCLIANAWSTAMFGFWSARQRVDFKYRLLVAVTLAASFIAPASGVVAILSVETCKVEARILCITVTNMAFYGGMFVYYCVKGRTFFDRGYWSHALKFNLPLVPHYLSQSVLHQISRVMTSTMIGAAAAGIYGLASSLAALMTIINQAVVNVLSPWAYKQIKQGNSKQLARVSYVVIALVGVANLTLIAFAPEILWLFAPPEYSEGVYAIPPLAGGTFLMIMYNLFAYFEFYFEKTGYVAVASVVGALVNVVANYVLMPAFGFVGAGYSTLMGYVTYILLHYVFMRRVQVSDMGGERVYSPLVLAGLCLGFALVAGLLAIAYPYVLVRVAVVVAFCVVAIVRRRDLLSLVATVRSVDGRDE